MVTAYKVHGSIISSRLNYIKDCWGIISKNQIINSLSIKERNLIKSSLFENTWIDFSTLLSIDKIIINDFANGNHKFLHELGRFSAEYSFHRLPLQLINQDLTGLLKACSRINALFQNFGQIFLEKIEVKNQIGQAVLVYQYPLDVPAFYCISVLGYFERLLELLGYYVIKIREINSCTETGGHRYEVWWQAVPLKRTLPIKLNIKPIRTTTNLVQQISKTPTSNKVTNKPNKVTNKPNKPNANNTSNKFSYNRLVLLSVLVLLTIALNAFQNFANTNNKFPAATSDKIWCYQNANNKDILLSLDFPYVALKTTKPLSNIKITVEVDNQLYFYRAKEIPTDRVAEISLGEFISSNNQAFNLEKQPKKFTLSAVIEGSRVEYCYDRVE